MHCAWLTVSLAWRAVFAAGLLAGLAQGQTPPPQPGDLDPSFSGVGWTTVPLGVNDSIQCMAVQPDGRVLIGGKMGVGSAERTMVMRLNPDGSPDTSFNNTGRALLPVLSGYARGLAVRSDGSILAGAFTRDTTPTTYLMASFLPNGSPDLTFGPALNGRAVPFTVEGGTYRMRLQPPDGKILACSSGVASVVRLLPNGAGDPSFGSDGAVTLPGPGGFFDLAAQNDGKILLCHVNNQTDLATEVTRLLPNGAPDPGFGTGGTVQLGGRFPSVPQPLQLRFVAALPGGKILVAGNSGSRNNNLQAERGLVLLRLLPDGSTDPAFGDPGTPGLGRISFGDQINVLGVYAPIFVQRDGHVLLAGVSSTSSTEADVALARFTPDGRADMTFGSGGRIMHDLNRFQEHIMDAALVPGVTPVTDKLMVMGIKAPIGGGHTDMFVARFIAASEPALRLEYPPGHALREEYPARVDFGPVTVPVLVTEVILKNSGIVTLTNIQAAFTAESHPGAYLITLPAAAASLAPGAQCSATLSFTPSAAPGGNTATLRLTAGTAGVEPRVVALTGSKATPLQAWRVAWFGSPDNSGSGADGMDFDEDGLPNFMEYALRSNPHAPSPSPLQPVPGNDNGNGNGNGAFTYSRPSAALTEFSYEPEFAQSPAGPWSSDGLTSTVLSDDGTVQEVRVTPAPPAGAGAMPPRLFIRLRVAKR